MKKTILALSLFLCASPIASPVYASGWIDDWLDQSNTTQGGYFEGQQRGYYSAGSFKGRWKNSADYPVTIEPPRIKSGCGGIDVFMGGFSFMDANYLSEKLQRILTSAAGVAFDLALKTMCEQCSNTIKNMEALSDTLNGMQIDDCAAGKALVGIVADENGIRSGEEMKERLGTAIKENKLSSGVATLWSGLTTQEKANNGAVDPGDAAKITEDCPNDLKEIFLDGETLLGSMGEKMSVPTTYLNLMRGLVGDVKLEGADKQYKVTLIAPCPENTPESLKSFLDGEIYAKNENGSCAKITDQNRNLNDFYGKKLKGIADKIKGNSAGFSAAEIAFLDTSPISPLPILKSAVATRTEGQAIGGLAEITAKAHTLQMVTDLYARADIIGLKAQEVLAKKSSSQGDRTKCAAYMFNGEVSSQIDQMMSRINQVRKGANDSYIASVGEMNAILSYMQNMQNIEGQMFAEVTRRYGKDMANRVH